MGDIQLNKDLERASLTITAEYAAPVSRVWQLWADPRQFERWWGPPGYPATVTDHALSPGGTVRYFMTGPDGEQYHGGWRVLRVEAPHLLEFEDFFADEDGAEVADLPTSTTVVSVDEANPGSRMSIETRYASIEDMQKSLEMGMEEGITLALGQIDDILVEQPA